MKQMITITILLAAFATGVSASNYEETMLKTIEKMYQTTSVTELGNLANQFNRISNAEKDKWLPAYYASYCYLRSTYFGGMDSKEVHKQLDLAQAELDNAKKIAPDESEIHALQAHIYQLRITDMSMGMKYSSLASESLAKAEHLNSENPRVFYLKGTNIFYTPESFGGGAKNAKPVLQKAAKMFENYKPGNSLMPSWGAEHNAEVLALCGTN